MLPAATARQALRSALPDPPPTPATDLTDELERLAALHAEGSLSREEFDEAKARLLAR